MSGQLFLGGVAHGAHRRLNPPASANDFGVRDALQLLLPLSQPITGPANVRMTIDECRHEDTALRVNHISVGRRFHLGTHRTDFSVDDQDVALGNDAEFAQLLASARTAERGSAGAGRTRKSEYTGIANKQGHWPTKEGRCRNQVKERIAGLKLAASFEGSAVYRGT